MSELNTLSLDDAVRWCDSIGLTVDGIGGQVRVGYPDSHLVIRLPIPAASQRVLALAYVILMTCVPDDEEERFLGGLVWINDWGIGSPTFERLGSFIVERLTACSLEKCPAITGGPNGFDALYAVLVQTLTYQWDAHYVPQSAPFVCHVSHDGYIGLLAKDRQTHDNLSARFAKGRWQEDRPNPTHL